MELLMAMRQFIACVLMLVGGGIGLMVARGEIGTPGVTLALGFAVLGGLVFDSDTFVKAIRAWRGKEDA
jgi:hypothetical protein